MLGRLLPLMLAVQGCAVWKSYGPYPGTVEEVGTGRPIEGAAIVAVYETDTLTPAGSVSNYLDAWETVTGPDGAFRIPNQILFTFRPFNVWTKGPSVYVFMPGFGCYPENGGKASVRDGDGFVEWPTWPLPEGRELKILLPPVSQKTEFRGSSCGPSDCPIGECTRFQVPYDKMRNFQKLRHMELVRSGARERYVYDVETDLFLAVEGNDRPQVGRLLKAGADVDARNAAGYSPLMLAAERGRPDIAALLIGKGAKVNGTDAEGKSPLLFALDHRQEETARVLLERGADPNLASSAGFTPLMAAAITGKEGLARELLKRGARVGARTVGGTTALHYGATHLPVLEVLLDHGAAINDRDRSGRTVFMFTLTMEPRHPKNTAAILRFLLERGLDPKLSTGGVTPLFQALQGQQWEAAEVLIDVGGDVNAAPLGGLTPLMMVAWRADGSPVLAEKLLARGARIDASDSNGDTALLMAIRAKNLAVAQFLISRGADVNLKNKAGESPLSLAKAMNLAGIADNPAEQGAKE